jgi:hypothetical protein
MNAPKTLNGYRVIAAFPKAKAPDMLIVLVHRHDNAHQPYVVASWNENCKGSWTWGHYYDDLIDAVLHWAKEAGRMPNLAARVKRHA